MADDSFTLKKMLDAIRDVQQMMEPDPLWGARAMRCNEKMLPDARLAANIAGIPVMVSDGIPDGYIIMVKPGRFGLEVCGIIGPEGRPALAQFPHEET